MHRKPHLLSRQVSSAVYQVCYFSFIPVIMPTKSLRCEHRSNGHQGHLILRNLQELDHTYLEALFKNDLSTILTYERNAANAGYGPLAPCHTVCSPREQKLLCRKYSFRFDLSTVLTKTAKHIGIVIQLES